VADTAALSRPEVAKEALEAWARHLGRHVEAASLREELTRGSLTEAFSRAAAAAPQRPALDVDGVVIAHGELDARAARLGGWLRAHGVRPGDRVLVAGATSVELVLAYLGILRAGAAMVPADPGATQDELAHLVADSAATAAWGAGPVLERLAAVGALALVASLDADGQGAPTLAQAVDEGEPLAPGGSAGDLALLAYTSGTTGRPKGVALTHANLLASLRGAMGAWRFTADDVLVHALPLSHQHGLSGVQMSLLTGARAALVARFDPERLCATVQRAPGTVVFAVPAMYERLLRWEGLAGADLRSVRLWVSGSAPLSPALARRLTEVLGEPPLERYGSTEAGLSVGDPYEGPRRVGAVGLPLPGLELAIAGEGGRPADPGEDGEILLRGPQVFGRYWGQEEATAEAFTGEGWFRTGDLGRLDPEDGYLTITGRLKELIVSGGLNVYPREVELALEEHPAVERAAVVGVPSERWGEEVVAFVVLAESAPDDLEEEELMGHARARLSSYKCPKRAFTVPALPLSDTGKVQRRELIEMATTQAQEA